MSVPLRLGTRGSRLALWQAHWVRDRIATLPGAPPVEIVRIETAGDRIQDVSLSSVGSRDFFTKDIESALLDGRVDLAVHSLKDLATRQPDGLTLGAVLERADPRDALVATAHRSLEDVPDGARIGTSSLRRRAFLSALRPGLVPRELRGNVPTRLQRLDDGDYDAVLLACAGLDRLELGHRIVERLDPREFTPAPAQGAVGIEIRADDPATHRWIAPLQHPPTRRCTDAERVVLRILEGGCQVPVGALAHPDGDALELSARVASLDGTHTCFDTMRGPATDPAGLGERLAHRLVDLGAADILRELRAALPAPDGARP